MEECVFCEIVAGRCPKSAFYEDDVVIGIMTIGPVTPGHAMVIPKKHVPYMRDMDFFLADGEAAFQDILHVHMHVFPRWKGDPFKLVADWDAKPPRAELDRIAGQIRAAYERRWRTP